MRSIVKDALKVGESVEDSAGAQWSAPGEQSRFATGGRGRTPRTQFLADQDQTSFSVMLFKRAWRNGSAPPSYFCPKAVKSRRRKLRVRVPLFAAYLGYSAASQLFWTSLGRLEGSPVLGRSWSTNAVIRPMSVPSTPLGVGAKRFAKHHMAFMASHSSSSSSSSNSELTASRSPN